MRFLNRATGRPNESSMISSDVRSLTNSTTSRSMLLSRIPDSNALEGVGVASRRISICRTTRSISTARPSSSMAIGLRRTTMMAPKGMSDGSRLVSYPKLAVTMV